MDKETAHRKFQERVARGGDLELDSGLLAANFDLHAEDKEPFVPSRGIVLVQFGKPHLIYHQGTDIKEWLSEAGTSDVAIEMMGADPEDGLFVWSGHIASYRDYWGEYDAWLEADEVRPITEEEWKAFLAEEIVWDFDEMRKYLDWEWAAEKAARNEEEKQMTTNTTGNEFLRDIINTLSKFSDDAFATPLAQKCAKFGNEPHTEEEQVRFLRDLRDMSVYGAGASPFIMQMFSLCLDTLPPEPEDQKAARIAELEKSL